jgi:hypothetical protein
MIFRSAVICLRCLCHLLAGDGIDARILRVAAVARDVRKGDRAVSLHSVLEILH